MTSSMSSKGIAEITGLTVNYVGVKISRIKQALEESVMEAAHGNL